MSDDALYRFRARQNKEDGNVDITPRGVRWWNGTSSVWLPWSIIEKHEVSPKTHAKAMLKISTKDKAVILTILEANKDRAYENLMQAKETMNVVVKRMKKAAKKRPRTEPSSSKKIDDDQNDDEKPEEEEEEEAAVLKKKAKTVDEAQRREAELAADDRLRALHRDLVGGGTLDDATFWATREQKEATTERKKPVSNELLVDAPVKKSAQKLTYTLNAEKKAYVFAMYPAVQRAHDALVVATGKMTEAQFWVKYFQSKYFLRDKGGAVLEARTKKNDSGVEDDMFARYEDVQDDEQHQPNHRVVARAVEIAKTEFDRPLVDRTEEPPENEEPSGPVAPKASYIVSKVNRHADLVVQATVEPRDDTHVVDVGTDLRPPEKSFEPLFVDDFRNPDFQPQKRAGTPPTREAPGPIAWKPEDVKPRAGLDAAPDASRAAFAFLDRKSQRANADDRPPEPFRSLAEDKASLSFELLRLLYQARAKRQDNAIIDSLKARLATLLRDLDRLRTQLRDQPPKGATHAAILKPLRDQIDLALA